MITEFWFGFIVGLIVMIPIAIVASLWLLSSIGSIVPRK